MNALPARSELPAARAQTARLDLFAVFHLNLAFSSIEESDRTTVIARCYWPLLALAATHGPIGIEATGFTLEEIEARDPAWIARFRELIAQGKAELVGSGYAQAIGPLMPAKMVAANLRIGNDIYRRLLGIQRPDAQRRGRCRMERIMRLLGERFPHPHHANPLDQILRRA